MQNPKFTPAQWRALEELGQGRAERLWPRGQALAAWERMMNGLCARGLATPYVHGGYEITVAGRAALNRTSPTRSPTSPQPR